MNEGELSSVIDQVRETLEHYAMFAPSETLVLGVSGGPDSLCLLHVMRRLTPTLGINLHVGHLDHGIRGDEAEEDARYVGDICRAWDTPCTLERADVPALAEAKGLAIEEAARRARYAFLADLARRLGGRTVAVAHNADDQVETVLMHLLRGSGLAGLRGMRPLSWVDEMRLVEGAAQGPRVRLLRPLLYVSRAEIEAYCRTYGLQPRYDRSNLDLTYYRNRLRHELIPMLETYNPNIRAVLRRTAEVMAADYQLLRQQLEEEWARVATMDRSLGQSGERTIVYDLAALRGLPLGLQRALLREGIHRLRRSLRNINWVHIDNAIEVLQSGHTGAAATLPQGLLLTLGYERAILADAEQIILDPGRPHLWAEPLAVPLGGAVTLQGPADSALAGEGWILETALYRREALAAAPEDNRDPYTAYLDADRLQYPLSLRTRREGDAFYPLGLRHQQKLRNFMVNVKIPRHERARLPLLVCGDEIAWVVGWRIDARYAVGEETGRVLIVLVRPATPSAQTSV
jgi:tRNA(Ile)-lysidine synthase